MLEVKVILACIVPKFDFEKVGWDGINAPELYNVRFFFFSLLFFCRWEDEAIGVIRNMGRARLTLKHVVFTNHS